MFMNYMDYTDEQCQNMFTKEQITVMREDLDPSGISYSVTQHPDLLNWPATQPDDNFLVYPNPTANILNIFFPNGSKGLVSISITNSIGAQMNVINVAQQNHEYTIDMSQMATGIYLLHINFSDRTVIKKVIHY